MVHPGLGWDEVSRAFDASDSTRCDSVFQPAFLSPQRMFVPIRIFFEERIPWGVGERFLYTLTHALLRVPVSFVLIFLFSSPGDW